MDINLTTLTENTATRGFIGEWGLSLSIEADNKHILFDTGPGFSVIYNAQSLSIDFKTIDTIVLSHGHFDHTGGLKDVLTRKGTVDVIAHPDIWGKNTPSEKIIITIPGYPFRKNNWWVWVRDSFYPGTRYGFPIISLPPERSPLSRAMKRPISHYIRWTITASYETILPMIFP